MLRDIAEFDRTEAWRGDGSLSMRDGWSPTVTSAAPGPAPWSKPGEGEGAAGTLGRPVRRTPDTRRVRPAGLRGHARNRRRPRPGVGALDADAGPRAGRRGQGATDADAAAQFQRRFVRFDDERCLFWAQLPGDSYALVKSAVIGRARRHDHPSANDPDYVRFESRCADALLQICVEQGRKQHRPAPTPPQSRTDPSTNAQRQTTSPPAPQPRPPPSPKPDPHPSTVAPARP